MITIEQLRDFGSVFNAIDWAQSKYPNYEPYPEKPHNIGKSSKEVREYADLLEKWEIEKEAWDLRKKECQKIFNDIDFVIESFIKEEAGLDSVPEQYRDKVWSKAWEMGHSDGYYSVYQKLESLVDIFS